MDGGGVSEGGATSGGLASWQTKLSSWMDDEEEQDSDTDSKLSGSAMVDSVMKRFRSKHSHYKDGHSYVTSGEFSLDPIRDHSLLEQDEENEQSGISPTHSGLSNGYHNSSAATRSPKGQRRLMNHSNSPRSHAKGRREYENTPAGNSYLFATRKKELLSPVPESTSSGARVVEILAPGVGGPQRGVMRTWGVSEGGGGMTSSMANTRSMENISGEGTPPMGRRRNYRETHIGMANGRPHYRDVRIPGSGYPSSSYTNVPPGGMYGGPGGGLNHSQSQEMLPYTSAFMDSGDVIGRGEFPHDHDGTRSDVGMSFGVHRGNIGSSTANSYIPGSASASATPSRHVHSHSHSGTVTVPNRPTHSRSGSTGSGVPIPYMTNSQSGTGFGHHLSPQHTVLSTSAPQKRSWLSDNTQLPYDSNRTPPQRRANYSRHEIPRDTSYHSNIHSEGSGGRYPDIVHDMNRSGSVPRSEMSGSRGGEPNLNDVVDFLSSDDPSLVSNAASYLQHLAYGDDSMKSKIRQYGAIPVLVKQLRNMDTRAQIAVLGALRNLSFGRTNEQNKLEIAGEHGLTEILLALKKSKVSEVRELLTSVLWNLSSSQELQLKMVKACIRDLVNIVLVPYSNWNADVAREQLARPDIVQWNPELRNTTGTLRNVSSAGEPARVYMRQTPMLIDALLWILKAGVQQVSAADEKTVENVACVLRNLSYRLENEIDPQEGADDVLDREWEMEQRREIEELDRSFTKSAPGCLAFLTRPRHRDNTPKLNSLAAMNRPIYNIDFANPDPSSVPKRCKPVYGMALLWQPEVVYVYLAIIEQYAGCPEAMEAAAGAVQNLTACNWKWAVYSRNIVRTSNGLKLIADLLNNSHDSVVRAAATAIRNLSIDPRNKASLGILSLNSLIPRLPFASNHLGISEDTSVALLCCLMELFDENSDNARMFREKEGIPFLTRLTRSRQHTQKVIFAASKVCSILYEYKDCKSVLKKDGWEVSQYHKLVKESSEQYEFAAGSGSMSRRSERQGSRRKKKGGKKQSSKKSKKKDRHDNEPVGGVRLEEQVQQPQRPQEVAMETHLSPGPASSHLPEITEEPNYQAVHEQTQQQPTSPRQQQQQLPESSAIIYQSIDDTQSKPANTLSSSRLETAGSIASGPASISGPASTSGPLSITSQEEDTPEPDPNATYASVDIEKKRASRRLKERQQRQQQLSPPSQQSPQHGVVQSSDGGTEEPLDSWV